MSRWPGRASVDQGISPLDPWWRAQKSRQPVLAENSGRIGPFSALFRGQPNGFRVATDGHAILLVAGARVRSPARTSGRGLLPAKMHIPIL